MCVEVMMDSGSSISLMMESFAKNYQNQAAPKGLKLVSAAGELVAPVSVGTLHVDHNFVVVHSLITPVILGIDFLHKHGIVLDFTTTPVTIQNMNPPPNIPTEAQPILESARHTISKVCTVASIADSSEDIIDNCAVFDAVITYDIPQCQDPELATLLHTHRELFRNTPGKTNIFHSNSG